MSVSLTRSTSNYLSCNGTSFGGLQMASALTIAGWFKPASISASSEQWCGTDFATAQNNFCFGSHPTVPSSRFNWNNGNANGATTLSAGNWFYFGMTQNNATFSGKGGCAASGAASFTFGHTGQINDTTATDLAIFIIGGNVNAGNGSFAGEICCVRFWNAQLTESELFAEMLSATPVKTAGLIANWRLANASDLTSTVNSYALTINGTVTAGSTEPTDIATASASFPKTNRLSLLGVG